MSPAASIDTADVAVRDPRTKSRTRSSGEDCGVAAFGLLTQFTRVWGVLSAAVLAGVGVDLAFHRHRMGYYLIAASTFVLVSEVLWVSTLFLRICVRSDHKIWKLWQVVLWFENWKKSVFYTPIGIVPIVWPHNLWLSYLAGGQMLALSFFHFLLSFKKKNRRRRKERLIPGDVDSFDSSKFEEITEVLDNDSLPEPMPGSSHSLSDSLAEQATVIEI